MRTIDRTGGTFLHTSRTNPSGSRRRTCPIFWPGPPTHQGEGDEAIYDFTAHVLNVLEFLELDALIPIGGDDTLSYAARLHQEGFPVVAIPKTMDNDVYGTDYCIGFSTAVTRSVDFITALRTTSGSHERHRRRRAVRAQLGRDISHRGLPGRRGPGHHLRGTL